MWCTFVELTVHIVPISMLHPNKKLTAGQWKTTHTWYYSCPCVWPCSENNSTFSTVFTHVTVRLHKHGNPFIYKGTVWSILDNVSFMVPRGPFFLSTKPPNWFRHVCNRPHSFDIDTSREISQWFCCASQEEWSWFTEAAICSEHKRTMDTRQMQ